MSRWVLAWLAALVLAPTANAHTLSESLSSWQIQGDTVRVQFTVPDLEARRLSPSGDEVPSREVVGDYLAAHLGASSGEDTCPRVEGPRPVSASPEFIRIELVYRCPAAEAIVLHSTAFYELVPTHTNFARIQDADGRFFEEVLTAERQDIDVSGAHGGEGDLQNAGLLTYIQMGIHHIFTGVDHMSFMLGLVLISRRVRDLLFVVTGFTLGHSLTLALAVTGILRPDAQYIDALVALTIALIGAEIIGDTTHRPLPVALGLGGLLLVMALARQFGAPVGLPMLLLIGGAIFSASYLLLTGHMRDAGRIRLLVTLIFGLIHGFGFAANLLEMRVPPERLAELLVGFNVGVEIGQVTVVLGALLVAHLLSKIRLAVPRPLFTDLAAAFLVGEGLYWFLGRSVLA